MQSIPSPNISPRGIRTALPPQTRVQPDDVNRESQARVTTRGVSFLEQERGNADDHFIYVTAL
jgi:hypothetical protein